MIHTYDPSADALYMQIRPGKTARTLEIREGVYVDVDAKGWTLGIEVLHPDASLLRRLSQLAEREQAPPLVRLTG